MLFCFCLHFSVFPSFNDWLDPIRNNSRSNNHNGCAQWPSTHYAVSSPALSKRDKLEPKAVEEAPDPLQHRMLAVYVANYRIVAGAWYRNHISWLEQWLPKETYSGLPRRECLEMTWDLKSRIQQAAACGDRMAILLLDYWKFFLRL